MNSITNPRATCRKRIADVGREDKGAKAIMENAQKEEFKHFGMNLEFVLSKKPKWRGILKGILIKDGDIVKLGEEAEEHTK